MLYAMLERPFLDPFHIGLIGTGSTSLRLDDIRVWSEARTAAEIALYRSAWPPPDIPGLERLYRFDDSPTEVADRTGSSAPAPLPAGITVIASDAPVAPDPAAPVAPGSNAEVDAYIYDTSMDDPLAHDDIVLEFDPSVAILLTRRWAHSNGMDEPIAFETYEIDSAPGSGTAQEVFSGRLGSISKVVDVATGAVVANYDYDSFGIRSVAPGATVEQLFGFTGRHHDAESGLSYFRARHQSPDIGKFIQPDPIEFDGGDLNIFAYVQNDPVNLDDPTGLAGRQGGSPRRPRPPGTSSTEHFVLGAGKDIMREAAIEAVATGVFAVGAQIVGGLALSTAQLDAVANQRYPGGTNNPQKHHCWPKYQSGTGEGPQVSIKRKRHALLHAMKQEYMRVYNLHTYPGRGGAVLRTLNRAYIRKITRQFYDDMAMYFGAYFLC